MPKPSPKKESLLLNLVCNIVAPTLILSKLSGDDRLGPQIALITALAFPLIYGIYDWIRRDYLNFISVIGFLGTLVRGSIGLLELDGIWVVVSETTMPILIGVMVLLSMRSKSPLVKTFIYNDQVIDVEKIEQELEARNNKPAFEKIFEQSTYILAFSFLISAILNFVIAKAIVTSPGGTEAFNQQIAKMTWVSYIVITIPTLAISAYAMWKLFHGIKELTGISFMDAIHTHEEEKKPKTGS